MGGGGKVSAISSFFLHTAPYLHVRWRFPPLPFRTIMQSIICRRLQDFCAVCLSPATLARVYSWRAATPHRTRARSAPPLPAPSLVIRVRRYHHCLVLRAPCLQWLCGTAAVKCPAAGGTTVHVRASASIPSVRCRFPFVYRLPCPCLLNTPRRRRNLLCCSACATHACCLAACCIPCAHSLALPPSLLAGCRAAPRATARAFRRVV